PVSKNTSWPSVNSSSAPPKRDFNRRAARATPRTRPKSREKKLTTRSLSPRGKLPITTAAERPRPMLGGQPEAELAQRAVVLPPVVSHLHPALEKHRDPEERFQLTAGRAAHPLEHGAALADHDALLRFVLHEDRRADVEALRPRPLLPLFHPDRRRVRHLLVREVEDLFADHLGHPERLGLIAGGIGRKQGRVDGQRP